MKLPRTSEIITIIAFALIAVFTSEAMRYTARHAALPSRPTPPQIDPSAFSSMSPEEYNRLVDYERARDEYDRELVRRIRAE